MANVRPFQIDTSNACPVSPSDLSDIHAVDLSGILSGRRVDLDGMRRRTPGKWSAFIRAHFRDPVAVAYFFNVDEKSARNWWHGRNEPRLSALSAMLQVVPVNARIVIVNYLAGAA
ncbi:MAG: hypothetical protein RSE12_17120 [Fuscovulum sp.]|nr:MAG: hypothetical protein RSE12_17120 [Fuscovulum sp.]